MPTKRWHLWLKAHESGETCGETLSEGRWLATCNLPPGHELPHQDRRGFGTVVFATWPFKPLPPREG